MHLHHLHISIGKIYSFIAIAAYISVALLQYICVFACMDIDINTVTIRPHFHFHQHIFYIFFLLPIHAYYINDSFDIVVIAV